MPVWGPAVGGWLCLCPVPVARSVVGAI